MATMRRKTMGEVLAGVRAGHVTGRLVRGRWVFEYDDYKSIPAIVTDAVLRLERDGRVMRDLQGGGVCRVVAAVGPG